ncbi:MAG TPA: hypothetical protein VMU50_20755 [Polyangia bacterium]|nr:hypothetical protein [Polyangia bacterium]
MSASPRRWRLGGLVAALASVAACHGQLRFDDASCATDADCGIASLHCLAGACVACAADLHCTTPGLPRCDLALHRCVECGVSSDCPGNQTCRASHCATTCASVAVCPATAPRCDDGFCVQCDDGVGCPASAASRCLGHRCVGCTADTDCGGVTPRCDVVTRACVQCQGNTDCSSATPLCDPTAGRCLPAP